MMIGVLWGHSQHFHSKFISTFRLTQLIRIQYNLYVPCTLFRPILWPSSASCAVYVKEKELQVDAPPLQAVYTTIIITIIPNSGIILNDMKIKNW